MPRRRRGCRQRRMKHWRRVYCINSFQRRRTPSTSNQGTTTSYRGSNSRCARREMIPNKFKPFGFAPTKWRSPLITTIASRELASNIRKPFSLTRSASCSLRYLSATLFPSVETYSVLDEIYVHSFQGDKKFRSENTTHVWTLDDSFSSKRTNR
jgi:hypothetical protein